MHAEIDERNVNSLQVGPERKEFCLLRAKGAFNEKNLQDTIFYLVKSLFRVYDARYASETSENEVLWPAVDDLISTLSEAERLDFADNMFMQEAAEYCRQQEKTRTTADINAENPIDFLSNNIYAAAGYKRITKECANLPKEWCIVQLCKGFNENTTLTTFSKMQRTDSDIYMTVLRHCRSDELNPICIHFPIEEGLNLFEKFSKIRQQLKECISVDPKTIKTSQSKQKYWQNLSEFNAFLESCIRDLRNYFYPLTFLLLGKRYDTPANSKMKAEVFKRVDEFSKDASLDNEGRVLLSQAALHASYEKSETLADIVSLLNVSAEEANTALKMLEDMARQWKAIECADKINRKRYPCILLIDERLDHFLWEELALKQEFTRVKSLHALLRLHNRYKKDIKHGYYTVNLKDGYCLLNPDKNLPKSSMRLNSFFQYWMPHWEVCLERRPAPAELLNVAFRKDCFIYAGHGSGLQYLSGRQVARARVDGVVFLFGCDSSRMCTNGLYSTLIDPHVYYQAAFCPTLVGTLMPALDANMDAVSTEILSRWIAPNSVKILPWNSIERNAWLTHGDIKATTAVSTSVENECSAAVATPTPTTVAIKSTPNAHNLPNMEEVHDYHIGSLCRILSNIHRRLVDPKAYNSCIYICRGLPAWNINVEHFPF